jgi:hypothetical protein
MNNSVPLVVYVTFLSTGDLKVEVETDRGKREATREFS